MSKPPIEVGDFLAVPVTIKSPLLRKDVRHYIYVKAYEPKIPDEDSPRALFLVNIPVTSTDAHIRHLFRAQLSAGHVQNVYFASHAQSTSTTSLIATTPSKSPASSLGKRKRNTKLETSDYESQLSSLSLPSIDSLQLHKTGSTAIVIFIDRTSRDQAIRACRKASKSKSLVWAEGLDASKASVLGKPRYAVRRDRMFPPRAELLGKVEDYMTMYAELEGARARESAKKRAEPDEDGFVTVTRGSKGVVKQDELEAIKAKLEEKKRKDIGLEDFYRFQMREKRKAEQGQLVKQFEEEQKQVNNMRQKRLGMSAED